MATITKWSNVAIAMQSALAAAKTITGITKAAPGVVTSVAHGYSNGDYVYLDILGMRQIHDRVFRVCNQAADTFQLEAVSGGAGIDTSAYDTVTSGSAPVNVLPLLSTSQGSIPHPAPPAMPLAVSSTLPPPAATTTSQPAARASPMPLRAWESSGFACAPPNSTASTPAAFSEAAMRPNTPVALRLDWPYTSSALRP